MSEKRGAEEMRGSTGKLPSREVGKGIFKRGSRGSGSRMLVPKEQFLGAALGA